MILSTLSIIATLVILNLHHGNSQKAPSDSLINFCRRLAKVLCMHPGHLVTAKTIEDMKRWKEVQAMISPKGLTLDEKVAIYNTYIYYK